MTRIWNVRFLLTLVMTTAFIGCSSGSSSPGPSTSPQQQKYQDFMSLKSQIISAGLPLNANDRNFHRRIQDSARDLGRIRLRPVQLLLHRYVRLGQEVEALMGSGALTLSDTFAFTDDYEKGKVAEMIVDYEMSRPSDWEEDHRGSPSRPPGPLPPPRPRVDPLPPSEPPGPPNVGPRPPFSPSQAEAYCRAQAEKLNRPCRIEKGRIVNQLFVADPSGQDICHCPSGTFERHSDSVQ